MIIKTSEYSETFSPGARCPKALVAAIDKKKSDSAIVCHGCDNNEGLSGKSDLVCSFNSGATQYNDALWSITKLMNYGYSSDGKETSYFIAIEKDNGDILTGKIISSTGTLAMDGVSSMFSIKSGAEMYKWYKLMVEKVGKKDITTRMTVTKNKAKATRSYY